MIENKYRVNVLVKAWKTRNDGTNSKIINNRLINGEKVRIKRRDLGRNTLKNLWYDSVWNVLRKMGTNETYEVKAEDGKLKVMHRSNMKIMEGSRESVTI